MGIEEFATAVMSEIGWIQFLLVMITLGFGTATFVMYRKLRKLEETVIDILNLCERRL